MPSFIYVAGSYPAYFQLVLNQFCNVHKADWVLVNTFYKLEEEVVDAMAKLSPLITIGPTIPSKDSEEAKLPKHFIHETSGKGWFVKWSPQLEVLANEAVGCFFTHCGWNSTVEALSLGVPMVGMPQWTDQTTDAKFVEDVWKVGIRVRVDENGIVGRKEVEDCIREVMEGERGKAMKENAKKWRKSAVEAVSEGGTSDKNIDEFVAKLIISS
ncbi:unnamed protein product, partial [Vitis vinifera]